MFCGHCGNQLSDNVKFCPACGKPVAQEQTPSVASPSVGAAPTAAAVATAVSGTSAPAEAVTPEANVNAFKVTAENAVQGASNGTPANPVVDAAVYNNPTVQSAVNSTTPSAVDAGVYDNPTVQNAVDGAAPADSTFAQVSFDTPASVIPKPKFRFKAFLFSGIAVVLAATIVTSVALIKKNKNKVEPSEAKAAAVALYDTMSENSTPAEKTKALSDVYGLLTSQNSTGAEAKVGLNVSDEMITTLESLLASSGMSGFDMDWLQSMSVALKINSVDNKTQIIATLYNGNNRLLDAEAILDIQNNTLYLGVPTLSSTYISMPLDALDSMMAFMEGYEEMDSLLSNPESYLTESIINSVLSDPEFLETLPTEEEFLDFLNRYVDIIVAELPFDSEKSTTLTVGSITETVTEYTLDASENDLKNLTIAILTSLKTDPMITGYMDRLADYVANTLSTSAGDIASEYADAIDEAINEVQNEQATDKTVFTFVRYVDGNNDIAGRKLIVDEDMLGAEEEKNAVTSSRNENGVTLPPASQKVTVLYHAIAENAGNYESTFEVADKLTISGKGTISDNKKTGTYIISAGEGESFTYRLRDFVIDSRGINGSIIIDLPKEAAQELMDNELLSSLVSGMDMGIELKFTSSDISFRIDINLVAGNNTIFGAYFSSTLTSVSSIRIPSNTTDDINSWSNTINQDSLMALLGKSPFKEIMNAVTSMNSMAQMDSYYS